ncbi:TonB-dependent receptor [Massilia forsythiae]|uniref:TonB-dependent receptor n=1 Tax=Massilia forsythiae TaxID=2728020 RepID=A0A7Z2VYU6_9BURK|nr:TonB-dependent receptor [Massilia forsythiae]QJE01943.1 TonB-dependent receptor [Massilia forsythiae]
MPILRAAATADRTHSFQPFQRRRSAAAVAAVLALLAAQAASAQQAAAPATGDAPPPATAQDAVPAASVVRVAGTRQSVASAIDRKLRASTVVDSIVAEDIGQFPDKNVGEALSRVTGVQLSRDFGEGSQVSIRGVEPDLNRIEINGMSVLSTNGTAGRGAELRELASELIGSIDVYKGITADMTEGGVGGTVSINTRKPLDFKKPTIGGTLSAEQSSSRGGVQPRANLYMADKYLDGRLGLMANIVFDKVYTRNDYARNTSWRFLQDWDNSLEKTVVSRDPLLAAIGAKSGCSATTLDATQRAACLAQWNDYSPGIARYGIWTRDHKRSSAEFTAQYKVSNELSAWTSFQANTQRQLLNDRNFGTDFGAVSRLANAGNAPVYGANGVPTAAGSCVTPATTPDSMVVSNHYVTSYTVGNCLNVAGQGGQGAFSTSARAFKLDVDSRYLSGGFNYKSGRLDVDGLFNTAKSTYNSDSNNIVLTQNAPGLKVTLDGKGIPHFTFPAAYDPENASSYVQAQLQYRPTETRNSEDQAKLDFRYRLSTPFFKRVLFGAQARKADSKQYGAGGYLASAGSNLSSTADDVNVLSANVNQTVIYDPLYRGSAQRPNDTQSFINGSFATRYVNAAQMAALVNSLRERSPGTFFKGYGGLSNLPAGWIAPSYDAAAPNFDTSRFNHGYLFSAPGSDGQTYPQIPAFSVGERIAATYLRLDYGTELFGYDIDGNVGMRYTRTRDNAAGLFKLQQRVATSLGSSSYSDVVLSNVTTAVNNTYNDVLPSFNGTIWLMPDKFLARVGWAKAMARPRIDLLAPNATCTRGSGLAQFGGDGTDDCTAGNPSLKPYRSTNTDFSLEYYPSADSQLSVALFKKDISSYVLERVLVKNVDLFGSGDRFDVTQPVNGQGATTRGIELAARSAFTFLPGWLGGFGGDANYTRMGYTYARGNERLNILDGSVLPYPGMSRNSYNVSLWYDRGPINARIAYNYRDRFFTGANDVSGNPNFQEKTGFLDAKIQWRYNEHVTLSLEGKNLTDQAQITDAGDLFRINELAFSGRRYFVSLSIKN